MSLNWPAILACVVPNLGCTVNGIRLKDSVNGWFKTLKKPSWCPPDAFFGPVWTLSYTAMGYASYLVWRDAGMTFGGVATLPLALYVAQLGVAWSWGEICFGRRNLKMSHYAMLLADALVIGCGLSFYRVSQTAGLVTLPYFGWLLFCTLVTHRMYIDNPTQEKLK